MPQLSTFHSQLSASPAALPYNPALSLWLSVDPLSDKYPGSSPYVYCGNNPVRLVDVDGREIDEWDFNIITGECLWVSRKGGANTDYINVHDGRGQALGTAELDNNSGKRFTFWDIRTQGNAYSGIYCVSDGSNSYQFKYENDNYHQITGSANVEAAPSYCSSSYSERFVAMLSRWDIACRGHADNSRWEGHGDYWDRLFAKKAEPYVASGSLFFTPVSLINSGMTLSTGYDMFGNKAKLTDYGLSILGMILNEGIPSFIIDVIGALRTFNNEKELST